MSDDNDTALATRRRTSRGKKAAAAPKKRMAGGTLSEAYSEAGEQRFETMPERLAAKTQALQKRILAALKGQPMSILELAEKLEYDQSPIGLKRQLRMLMHAEQVRGFIEIPSNQVERLAFMRTDEAPSGVWDRDTLPGYECYNPRRVVEVRPPSRNAGKAVSARRQLALDLLKQAAALPKRQEPLALEMTRQAMKALLEEDSK